MNQHSSSGSSPGLVRALGPLMATAVVVGTVIGSGVFKKPASIADNVHYFGLTALVWVLGGALAFLGALALAEVAVLYPRAGGNYVYLREGYGRLGGFLWGWVEFWIIRSASIAALATIFAESLGDVMRGLGGSPFGYWELRGLTVAVIVGLSLVNARGVRWGGGLQLLITTVKVGSLLAILVLPFVAASLVRGTPEHPTPTPQPENLTPVWPDALSGSLIAGFGTAFLGVLWAYHGWMNVAPVAEEITEPQRNIPLALLVGVGIITFLYCGANLAYALIIPRPEMAQLKETTVVAEFGFRLLGPIGGVLASAAVMTSVFGALNGNLLVGPRLLYAMGEDGLAPRALAAVHARWRTPVLATLVLAGWAAGLVLGVAVLETTGILEKGKSHFDVLTDFAMFGAVIFETMAVLSIFIFRWRYPKAERAYRCWGYPVTPALYVIMPAFLLVNMFIRQRTEALIGVGFILTGALVYGLLFRGRPQT